MARRQHGTVTAPADQGAVRRRVVVRGVVQGVGFRPFVHGLASELGLAGYVTNNAGGVVAEIEGDPGRVHLFCDRISSDAPPLARVSSVSHMRVPPLGATGFSIRPSEKGPGRTLVPADTAVCAACLAELTAPGDRRYRHPFITCTHCGPRFTIVTGMPYDRASTTMAGFPLCETCAAEYADPGDRRFHAQPVACPRCGPRLYLTAESRPAPLSGDQALAEARRLLTKGEILAVKGIGGYHLACDACDASAVRRLRERKERGAKPFAVMAADMETVLALAPVGEEELRALDGPRHPVVLLRRREPAAFPLADAVCPGSPDVGVMLPYTPLHHLLFGLPGDPPGPRVLVMTSGNRSGEPIVTDDAEARRRLAGIADAWLWHDRDIRVPCDDSVVRVRADGGILPLRRSRGYAPEPVILPFAVPPSLAVGGDLKNTFCLAQGRTAWLSQHIGDMDELATLHAFEKALDHMAALTGVRPRVLAADRHPGYRSTQWAQRRAEGRPLRLVQHHHAHIASAMAEGGLDGSTPVIGVAFDGTGYGDDAAVWGGEVMLADYDGYRRLTHLAYVPLPGGDTAVRNPYRMALSHLRAAGIDWDPRLPCVAACPPDERQVLERQLERRLACVPTSSVGRLFDAVSSLLGVCHHAAYEAQAAIELEACAAPAMPGCAPGYAFGRRDDGLIDPAPVLRAIVADLREGVAAPLIAARFHLALADAVLTSCQEARAATGADTVALTGGVFANALLDEACTTALRRAGFAVLRHTHVPCGDGGLALGQLLVATRFRKGGPEREGEADVPGSTRQSDRH